MRRMVGLLLCLLLLAPVAQGEDALFAWTAKVGGDHQTVPAAMAADGEGGVFVAGYTNSARGMGDALGEKDGVVLRVGPTGTALWQKRLGGSADDAFDKVVALPDGGCLALGSTNSTDGDARAGRGGLDAWLVRLDAQGELLWSKCLGGVLDDELDNVLVTEDGMYFVYGRSQSRNEDLRANEGGWDAWAALLSPEDGKPQWTYRYGFGGDDAFLDAKHTHDGWLLLGVVDEQIGETDEGEAVYRSSPMAVLLGVEGEALWDDAKLLGDTGVNVLHAIVETETGWLLGGETDSRSALMPITHGDKDIWLLHMRQAGTVSWQRSYGGTRAEALHAIYTVPSAGFLLLGTTRSTDGQVFGSHGEGDLWLLRTNANGGIEWQQPIGGSGESWPAGVLLLDDGGFLVLGTTNSQDGDIGRHVPVRTGFITRLSSNGNLIETRLVDTAEEYTLLSVLQEDGVGYVLGSVRTVNASGPVEAMWISRLGMDGIRAE